MEVIWKSEKLLEGHLFQMTRIEHIDDGFNVWYRITPAIPQNTFGDGKPVLIRQCRATDGPGTVYADRGGVWGNTPGNMFTEGSFAFSPALKAGETQVAFAAMLQQVTQDQAALTVTKR